MLLLASVASHWNASQPITSFSHASSLPLDLIVGYIKLKVWAHTRVADGAATSGSPPGLARGPCGPPAPLQCAVPQAPMSLKFVTLRPGEEVVPDRLNLWVLRNFFSALPDGVVCVIRRPSGEIGVKLSPDSDALVEALRRVKDINGVPVKVLVPLDLNLRLGVVNHPEIKYMTEEELKNLLCTDNEDIDYVKKPKPDGDVAILGWPLATVSSLPATVVLGWDTVVVRPYVPRPTRCFQCQQYGHIASRCTVKVPVCGRCGRSGHCADRCTAAPHCPACGGDHLSSDPTCPRWEEEKIITAIKYKHNVSYADALKKRQHDLEQPEHHEDDATQDHHEDQDHQEEPATDSEAVPQDITKEEQAAAVSAPQAAAASDPPTSPSASDQPDQDQDTMDADGFTVVKRGHRTPEQEADRQFRKAKRRVRKEEEQKKKDEEEHRAKRRVQKEDEQKKNEEKEQRSTEQPTTEDHIRNLVRVLKQCDQKLQEYQVKQSTTGSGSS